MNWLIDNWIWIAVVLGFLVMHFFGHGHGRHGSGHGHRRHGDGDAATRPQSPNALGTAQRSKQDRTGHNHGAGSAALSRGSAAVAAIDDGPAKQARSTHGRHKAC